MEKIICFVFRALHYPPRQCHEMYNLHLGSNEVKMMRHVLYLVRQLQLGGGDHVSDRSDSEDDGPCGEDWYDDCEIPSNSENTDIDEYFDESIDEDVDSEEDEEAEKISDIRLRRSRLLSSNWLLAAAVRGLIPALNDVLDTSRSCWKYVIFGHHLLHCCHGYTTTHSRLQSGA
ncbi:hypothetical protein FOMG_19141 [Fusarium oxysporum f. sp. melonis 26406]|uniref:Uncharacterized protein n=1 Tax=Fusarium oxysporum f. sp. melonis 26406 TaxID=1089452 RepID=W9ZSQ4_FUSOX|nr:hypothetical protein FOMG_19141 [Fusarium oxysporum f. sp. melonis 26406]